MSTTSPFSGTSGRLAILIGSAVIAAIAPLTSLAQEREEQEDIQEVTVTGSRLATDVNATAPVQTVTIDTLTYSGNFNTVDVLNNLPALTFSTTVETSNQDGGVADGQNTLNLRGMGEDRTLVLVNGRRHVSGVEGSQAVDVGSIPPALIERVEVLTGGASAIYGADAVTGVVNFILKKDFEGFDFDAKTGLSREGDGEQLTLSGLYGRNFADERGNFTLGVNYYRDPGLKMRSRDWSAGNRISDDDVNPALRFQKGEISANATPNFARFYDFDTTFQFPYGLAIPAAEDFAAAYADQFGTSPVLSTAELALLQRAASAPSRAILPQHNFSISSARGIIAPGDFSVFNGIDVDGNGVQDCLDSFTGYNSSLDGASSFGILGGCWAVGNDGRPRPVQEGLVAGDFNGFGGDGIENFFDEELLIPREDRAALNLTGRFELSPAVTFFGEAKYVYSDVDTGSPLNTFWDLLFGAPDNPFLPTQLQALAVNTGGLFITRDNVDIGPNVDTNERRTMRFVGGIEGKIGSGWSYEISGNHGEFQRTEIDRNYLLSDRWFAAIDVIADPSTGQPICRSDLDPTLPPTTVFGIPSWDSGFFTFTPGDGQCRPANIWGGIGAVSQEAIDFFTTTVENKDTITQTVFSATLIGDSEPLFTLPAGAVGLAMGVEWREETSKIQYDSLELGIMPEGTPFTPGELVETVSGNSTLGFEGSRKLNNAAGRYDVYDVFAEVSIPVVKELPFADSITLDGAYRFAEYSTIGSGNTWKVGLVWTPIQDVRLRGNVSQAVRAPNIFELFSPDQPAFFRPVDPCVQAEIDALAASDPATAAIREANCRAAGIPAGFVDPLSARFAGVSGGNADLSEETADTTTFGVVLRPRFIEGLTLIVDYWNIEIDDAIVAVSSQDIVDNCYDSPTFPNEYCGLFSRNSDPTSAQFQGFNFLRQTQINFGGIEASGVDFTASYPFSVGAHRLAVNVQATRQNKLDFFFDPGDPSAVDPELGELFRPEWAGNASLMWAYSAFELQWSTQYLGEQAKRNVEIETFQEQYGPSAIVDEIFLHDFSARYRMSDTLLLYGGVQNLTDETPYVTEFSWPAGPRGRYFFVGAKMSY